MDLIKMSSVQLRNDLTIRSVSEAKKPNVRFSLQLCNLVSDILKIDFILKSDVSLMSSCEIINTARSLTDVRLTSVLCFAYTPHIEIIFEVCTRDSLQGL